MIPLFSPLSCPLIHSRDFENKKRRYLFYAFGVMGRSPYVLFFLRYSLFFILYPTGITGEVLTMLAGLPDLKVSRCAFVYVTVVVVFCGDGGDCYGVVVVAVIGDGGASLLLLEMVVLLLWLLLLLVLLFVLGLLFLLFFLFLFWIECSHCWSAFCCSCCFCSEARLLLLLERSAVHPSTRPPIHRSTHRFLISCPCVGSPVCAGCC